MSRKLLVCALALLLALTCLSACGDDPVPPVDGTESTTPQSTGPIETEPAESNHLLSDKYDPRVNSIYPVAGTFTDQLDADTFAQVMTMAQSFDAPPMLRNIITIMGLTRDDIVLYSEMNGDLLLLESELIDGLFLEGEAMREALRGDHTIMAGGVPYTVYELAAMSADSLTALGIPEDELKAFLASVPAIAERTGENLPYEVEVLIEAYTADNT